MQRARRLGLLIALGLFAASAPCIFRGASYLFAEIVYGQQRRAVYELLRQLRDRCPPEVDARAWEIATNWAITAYCNVCFSAEHVSLEELKRFRADLDERLQVSVDLTTIDWIWWRLGRTGPQGKSYRDRFEAQYREELNAARKAETVVR